MILNATFENLALLGMLLAVFGGLAGGLGRRGAAGSATDRAVLGSLLATAFGVVFFAYLPHVLYTASGSELISWRVAHGLFAVWHLIVAVRFLTVARALLRGGLVQKAAAVGLPLLGLVVLAGQAMGALAAVSGAGYLLYLVALIWQLVLAAAQFGFVVLAERAD